MRRRTVIGGAAVACTAAAAGVWRFTNLVTKHYSPTPYDDLLAQLVDRGEAAKLGRAAADTDFDTAYAADALRERLGHGGLSAAAAADVAQGRLREAAGWVLPESVALLATLAARV